MDKNITKSELMKDKERYDNDSHVEHGVPYKNMEKLKLEERITSFFEENTELLQKILKGLEPESDIPKGEFVLSLSAKELESIGGAIDSINFNNINDKAKQEDGIIKVQEKILENTEIFYEAAKKCSLEVIKKESIEYLNGLKKTPNDSKIYKP